MRMRLGLPALAVALTGCQESPAGPYTPTTPPPAGLHVSLAAAPADPTRPIPAPTTITAAGDSVVVNVALTTSCTEWSPRAGIAAGVLVITVVDSMPRQGRNCLANLVVAQQQVVVRPAPSGTYDAVFRTRTIASNLETTEVERGRARVTVR